jgi:hypothetical protein
MTVALDQLLHALSACGAISASRMAELQAGDVVEVKPEDADSLFVEFADHRLAGAFQGAEGVGLLRRVRLLKYRTVEFDDRPREQEGVTLIAR